jgi:MFS family permease
MGVANVPGAFGYEPKISNNHYVYKYILIANIVNYLEAGAVPAMLVGMSETFHLSPDQQGLLGGIVYFTMSLGSPFAALCFKIWDPRVVLGVSMTLYNIAVVVFASVPVGLDNSSLLLVMARGAMGFTQAFLCVYLPLWIDEFAPVDKKTVWMSYSQASVPVGVVLGYLMVKDPCPPALPHSPMRRMWFFIHFHC